jgi:hypothetical protein
MRVAALAGLLLVAGCGEAERPLPPERPDAEGTSRRNIDHVPPKQLNLPGRWAANIDQCETDYYDFGGDDIRTGGDFGCSIMQEERTESSATLQLTCVGEGLPTMETWLIGGDDININVSRPNQAPELLVRCPDAR